MKDKEKQDYKQVQVRLLTEHLIESENRQKQKCNEEKQIEITENAVRKSKDNAGTMADLLKQEMEELQRAKQIEEMVVRLCDIADNKDIMVTPNPYSLIGWSKIAKELLKHYQVADKDSVVLSREEYQKDFSSQFNKGYQTGVKEIVEKIIKMIKQTAIPVAVGEHSNIKFIETSEEELNAIAKHLGAEIMED